MTLQLLHSEFPSIWGKIDFLFYQCTVEAKAAKHLLNVLLIIILHSILFSAAHLN